MIFKLFDKEKQIMIFSPKDFTNETYPEYPDVKSMALDEQGNPCLILQNNTSVPLNPERFIPLLNTFIKNSKNLNSDR